MPVVVTGANGFVGRATIPVFLDRGSEVRAVVRDRGAAPALRALGAKVAIAGLEDPGALGAVMRDAHTVCHLAGSMDFPDDDTYERVNHELTRSVLEAATEAGVIRFLLLSYPGASPDAANAYLRSKGRAEEAVRASGLQHVILRSTHVYGPGSRWLRESAEGARLPVASVVIGPGTQRLAPAFVKDVAAGLGAADDRSDEIAGTFGLQGPDVVTADDLADLLAGRRRRKIHLSPRSAARFARFRARAPSVTALEVLAADSLADAPDAFAEFGLPRTPLLEGLRTTSPKA
ncbi:MAG: SDR family oxidoreductase [Actinomycetota bacterium]